MSDMETLYELSNCEIMRLDVDDNHYYYGGKPGQSKDYYLSLTQVLDIGGPFPEGLRQYLRVTSYEEQKERLEATGNRGSKLHQALDSLMKRKSLDLRLEFPTTYEKDAITTFIRMMRFLAPTKFETEQVVADIDLKVAGTLDFKGIVDDWKLLALMDPNKYLEIDNDGDLQLKQNALEISQQYPTRVCVILDWKFTGRNTYSHKVQVSAYRRMYCKTHRGMKPSRAFVWRYSPRHKFGFDFNESTYPYSSFKRIYSTTIEYLGEFPMPPAIKKFPDRVRLYESLEPDINVLPEE